MEPRNPSFRAQRAEAGCYYKKRYDGKLFKFKKFSIKWATFISEISTFQVKAHKQKKNLKLWISFKLFIEFFDVAKKSCIQIANSSDEKVSASYYLNMWLIAKECQECNPSSFPLYEGRTPDEGIWNETRFQQIIAKKISAF